MTERLATAEEYLFSIKGNGCLFFNKTGCPNPAFMIGRCPFVHGNDQWYYFYYN